MMQLFCFALFLMEFYRQILKFIKNHTGSKIVMALKEENKIGKLNLLSVGQCSFHGSLLGTLLLHVLLLSQWKGRRSNQYDAVAVPGKRNEANKLTGRPKCCCRLHGAPQVAATPMGSSASENNSLWILNHLML